MIAAPYCLHCGAKVDPDSGVFVLVDGPSRPKGKPADSSWTCGQPVCLEWLARAAAEEGCDLLRPQGIFEIAARPDGLPGWVVWMSKEKRREEEESGVFGVIYQPFTPTAR